MMAFVGSLNRVFEAIELKRLMRELRAECGDKRAVQAGEQLGRLGTAPLEKRVNYGPGKGILLDAYTNKRNKICSQASRRV